MTAVATFMPTVGQAREAGFFPSRHTVACWPMACTD